MLLNVGFLFKSSRPSTFVSNRIQTPRCSTRWKTCTASGYFKYIKHKEKKERHLKQMYEKMKKNKIRDRLLAQAYKELEEEEKHNKSQNFDNFSNEMENESEDYRVKEQKSVPDLKEEQEFEDDLQELRSQFHESVNKEYEQNEVREESLLPQTSNVQSEEPTPSSLTMKERLSRLQQKRETIKMTKLPYLMNSSDFRSNKSDHR